MDAGTIWRQWVGAGRSTQVQVAVWRVASVASVLALVGPIMVVGRRPYRIGRLADRLRAIQDMALVPDSLPARLSWFSAAIVVTVLGGVVTPVRYRRVHGVVVAATLVVAVLVHRGASASDLTSPTTQLGIVIGVLAVAAIATALPARSGSV